MAKQTKPSKARTKAPGNGAGAVSSIPPYTPSGVVHDLRSVRKILPAESEEVASMLEFAARDYDNFVALLRGFSPKTYSDEALARRVFCIALIGRQGEQSMVVTPKNALESATLLEALWHWQMRAAVFLSALHGGDTEAMEKHGDATTGGFTPFFWLANSLVPPQAIETAQALVPWFAAVEPQNADGIGGILLGNLQEASRGIITFGSADLTCNPLNSVSMATAARILRQWRQAFDYLKLLRERRRSNGITENDLNETDQAIAREIRKNPGSKGPAIAKAVLDLSEPNFRRRVKAGMPLHSLGYRARKGGQGYFPPKP